MFNLTGLLRNFLIGAIFGVVVTASFLIIILGSIQGILGGSPDPTFITLGLALYIFSPICLARALYVKEWSWAILTGVLALIISFGVWVISSASIYNIFKLFPSLPINQSVVSNTTYVISIIGSIEVLTRKENGFSLMAIVRNVFLTIVLLAVLEAARNIYLHSLSGNAYLVVSEKMIWSVSFVLAAFSGGVLVSLAEIRKS